MISLKGDVLQLAECMLCKHKVTGSNPVISSAFVAQLAEHSYGKGKVPGSNPAVGCKNNILMHIRLVLKSYERSLLTKACKLLLFVGKTLELKTMQRWNIKIQPLPTKLKKYTLLRSPHIDKKSLLLHLDYRRIKLFKLLGTVKSFMHIFYKNNFNFKLF